jgi:hypothetical protein
MSFAKTRHAPVLNLSDEEADSDVPHEGGGNTSIEMPESTDIDDCYATDEHGEDTEGDVELDASSDIQSEYDLLAAMSRGDLLVRELLI